MKDIVTPVPQEEVKTVIRKCLEQAALVNYSRLSEYAKIEGKTPFAPRFSLKTSYASLGKSLSFLMGTRKQGSIWVC